MLDREKLKARLERQAARDDTNRRHWIERREARVLNGMEAPLLPRFCRICLVGMIGGGFMAFTGDLASARAGAGLKNAASSTLVIWLVFGIPMAIGCLVQLRRGFGHPWFDRHRLTRGGRPRMAWEKKYRLWIGIAAAGAAALALLSLLAAGR